MQEYCKHLKGEWRCKWDFLSFHHLLRAGLIHKEKQSLQISFLLHLSTSLHFPVERNIYSNWILPIRSFRQLLRFNTVVSQQILLTHLLTLLILCNISNSDVTHMKTGTKYTLTVLCKRPNITAFMKTIYSFITYSDKNTLSLRARAQSKSISTSTLFKSMLFFGIKIITHM